MSAPSGSVTTGQTSSRSTLSVQPWAISRAPERRRERIGRGIATAQAAQVQDVPVARLAGEEVVRDGLGDGRQVGRRAQDRGVVRVIRGPEEDGGRASAGPGVRSACEPWRRVVWTSASPGSTSCRCMSGHDPDDLVRGVRTADDDQRLRVGVRAVRVPPRSMEGPVGERRGPRIGDAKGVPGGAGDRVEVASLGAEGAAIGRGGVGCPACGTRTGRLRGKGWGGHGRMLAPVPVDGCGGNRAATHPDHWLPRMGPQARKPRARDGC